MNTRCGGALALALAIAVVACVGDGTGLDQDGNPLGSGNGTGDEVQLSRDVQPIFTFNCAVSGCHLGTQPAQGMNLSAGLAHQNIVDVAAVELPSMRRVRPLEPDASYLVHKVQGTHLTVGGSGDRMPLGGAPLTAQEIAVIRNWILLGAKNN